MERIKVMLVDDEHLILHDLQRLIDWNGLGFEIAATASSGRLGIEKYEKSKPHVIFTDIRMPIMDGLEMMEAIRKKDENVLFVVLSAYWDFRYAQQAMQQGAYAYILKNEINHDSLLGIVLTLKEIIHSHAKTAFMSICYAVQAYIKEPSLVPEILLSDLDKYFNLYNDLNASDWNLKSLSDILCHTIETAYKENGRLILYNHKTFETKNELIEWTCTQIQLIHRWYLEGQEGISPHTSKAVLFIEQNYPDPDLSIQKIADSIMVSASWLSICFKKEIGCTVNEYINNIRIHKSKDLLKLGEYKVYEIAQLVGFRTSQYFSKVFAQKTKQIPQQYRGESE